MMSKNILLAFAMVVSLFAAPAAFAGDWIKGQGETIQAALESAVKVAEARVKSKGKGCVDGRQRNLEKRDVSGTTVWSVEVYVHNQNGSCGIDANAAWIKSTATELIKSASK